MAARRLSIQSLGMARTSYLSTAQLSRSAIRTTIPISTQSIFHSRALSQSSRYSATNPAAAEGGLDLKSAPIPSVPDSEDPATDSSRHAAFLGEADSNDGHDAHQEAYGAPPPSLDAKNSAYLGEADSNDGFEHNKDIEGRKEESLDASQSAFLGEGDSDDGFEGRRAAHPEEGDHRIEDATSSGFHGESGEGDHQIEEGKR